MINFDKYRTAIRKGKDNISKEKAIEYISRIQNQLIEALKHEGRVVNVGKIYKPDSIQKYDIITNYICGAVHPCIIYAIDDEYAYAVGCTSTESEHVVYKFENSRFFKGKFLTNTVIRLTKQQALEYFVGIMDNSAEADEGFEKLRIMYVDLFKL